MPPPHFSHSDEEHEHRNRDFTADCFNAGRSGFSFFRASFRRLSMDITSANGFPVIMDSAADLTAARVYNTGPYHCQLGFRRDLLLQPLVNSLAAC
jgi:hypothetical protein